MGRKPAPSKKGAPARAGVAEKAATASKGKKVSGFISGERHRKGKVSLLSKFTTSERRSYIERSSAADSAALRFDVQGKVAETVPAKASKATKAASSAYAHYREYQPIHN